MTKDLANRSILIRIRQRGACIFRVYAEGGMLDHVQVRAGYFLGCVHSVVLEWLRQRRQKTTELRHSFRPWTQSLDWIVQTIFGLPPLLDAHEAAQQRTANSGLSFVRTIAISVEGRQQLLIPFTATQIFELAVAAGLEIPGLNRTDAAAARLRIGAIMGQAFSQTNQIRVDRYECMRIRKDLPRPDGDGTFAGWE